MPLALTKQQQQYAAAGAVALAALGFCYLRFFWLPLARTKSEAREKISEIEGKIDRAKKQASRLDRLKQELNALNEQAVEAEKRLPRQRSVPEILVTLSALAERHKVSIVSFSPGPTKPQQFFIELNYPVAIRGAYHNIGRFLAGLALEERIFNVMNVNFPTAGEGGELGVTFTLISYQYKG